MRVLFFHIISLMRGRFALKVELFVLANALLPIIFRCVSLALGIFICYALLVCFCCCCCDGGGGGSDFNLKL